MGDGKKRKKKGKKAAAAAAAAALATAETSALDEQSSDAAALARQQKVRKLSHHASLYCWQFCAQNREPKKGIPGAGESLVQSDSRDDEILLPAKNVNLFSPST